MRKIIHTFLALILLVFVPVLVAEPLDINSATAEQLDETLTGVGKVKAQAIVKDREKNGNFKSVDDLVRVKGIGSATIAKNRSKITAGGDVPAAKLAPQEAIPPAVKTPAAAGAAPTH